jgi:proline racemase
MNYINHVDDSVRRYTVFEPRGRAQMSVVFLFPPSRADADAGFLILQADRAHAMSGSNTIGVVTVLLETGMVPLREPQTVVRLETPAGLVTARADCREGKCERVTLDGVPSFVEALDVPVVVDGLGTLHVDLAYGGCYYALVEARQVGLRIRREDARALATTGARLLKALSSQVSVCHPELPGIDVVTYVMFVDRDDEEPELLRGCTVLPPGRVDRSPCGTGNSARLACMHHRGEAAILPRISGRGWIFGFHRIGLDPSDPYPLGMSSRTPGGKTWK